MNKIKWKDYRTYKYGKHTKYITNGAICDTPTNSNLSTSGYTPTWSIKNEEDTDAVYSFKKWYMKFAYDSTEQAFVDACFESDWKHWEAFKNCTAMRDLYPALRDSRGRVLYSQILGKIYEKAMDPNDKQSMTALKYLADEAEAAMNGGKKGKGRPKKADIEAAAKEIAKEERSFAEDLARIIE